MAHEVAHLGQLHISIEFVDLARADWRACDSDEVRPPVADLEVEDDVVAQEELLYYEKVDAAFLQVTKELLLVQDIKADIDSADSYGFEVAVEGVLDDIKRHFFFLGVYSFLHGCPNHSLQSSHYYEVVQILMDFGPNILHDKGACFFEIALWINCLEMEVRVSRR